MTRLTIDDSISIEVSDSGRTVDLRFERKPTPQERRKDPEARIVVESVVIGFHRTGRKASIATDYEVCGE